VVRGVKIGDFKVEYLGEFESIFYSKRPYIRGPDGEVDNLVTQSHIQYTSVFGVKVRRRFQLCIDRLYIFFLSVLSWQGIPPGLMGILY
jgi:hypothetical protein